MIAFLKKIKFSLIFWILFYILVFLLLLQHSFSYLDPDFGWHLRVGQEISLTRAVPHDNYYNYTFTGKWVDHEWLSNLVIYNIYDSGGYLALGIIFSVLVLLTFILLRAFTKKIFPRAPELLIALFQLFGLFAASPHLGIRVQVLGPLFLLLLLGVIYLYCKERKTYWLILLLPLFYLWANLHGSFVLGLALLLAFIVIKFLEKGAESLSRLNFINLSKTLSYRQIGIFSLFSTLSIFVTLLTPYYSELYSFLGGYRSTYYLAHIQEWLSQFYFPFQYWQLSYLVIVAVFTIIYLVNALYYRREKIDLWQLFLVLIFFSLSFKSRRHFPLLFIASFPFLIERITLFFNVKKISKVLSSFRLRALLIFCLLALAILQLLDMGINKQPFVDYCDDYPCQAVRFLQEQSQYDSLNIFNEYSWGGFMIWTYPNRKIFIDGRLPQVKLTENSFLKEYLSFFDKDVDKKKKLDEYAINLVLIRTKDEELKAKKWEKFIFVIQDKELEPKNYLRKYLNESDDWRIIYSDPTAIIYQRIINL